MSTYQLVITVIGLLAAVVATIQAGIRAKHLWQDYSYAKTTFSEDTRSYIDAARTKQDASLASIREGQDTVAHERVPSERGDYTEDRETEEDHLKSVRMEEDIVHDKLVGLEVLMTKNLFRAQLLRVSTYVSMIVLFVIPFLFENASQFSRFTRTLIILFVLISFAAEEIYLDQARSRWLTGLRKAKEDNGYHEEDSDETM